jgi:hypothetical protein
MKNIIKLGMLAALANVSVHAVNVDFAGATTPVTNPDSSMTVSSIVVSGYVWTNRASTSPLSNWTPQDVFHTNGTGIGVYDGLAASDAYVDGTQREHLLIDFGATATSNVQVQTLTLYYANTPIAPYFRYAWLSSAPNTGSRTLLSAGPPASYANSTPHYINDTAGFSTPVPSISGNLYTFGTPISGQGRYLLIGAVNGSLSTSNYFALNSLTYTSVPDGASTLALMGAALATLGFAGRRRKA